MKKVIITDCNFDSLAEEKAVCERNGFELQVQQCKSAEADALIVQYAPITKEVIEKLDHWQQDPRNIHKVYEAMQDSKLYSQLQTLIKQELIPVLEAMELGVNVKGNAKSVEERFLNPFLKHQLSDIAQNHTSKIELHILPLYEQGNALFPHREFPLLRDCLERNHINYNNTRLTEVTL